MIWYKRISAMMGTWTVMTQKEQGNKEYYGNRDNARHIRHNGNYPDCADYIAKQSKACYDKIYHTKPPA